MKLTLVIIISLFFAATSTHGYAKQSNLYLVAAAGYATNDINNYEHNEVSYKLNVGYVFNDQWSVELGYNGLGDSGLNDEQIALDNANFETNDYSITAFRVSALGKASNQHGELFYRIGVMHVNAQRTYALNGAVCEDNDPSTGTFLSTTVCQSDNNQIAGVIGIGFDFNVTNLTQLRIEIEHIQGQDDYSAQALLLGLRVNF